MTTPRKLAIACCLLVSFLSFASTNTVPVSPAEASTAKLIAITHGLLIDGSGHAPIKNSVVIVRDGLIEAVGSFGRIQIPAGAQVVDARGLVLAPGFIDTHSHADRGLESDPDAKTQVSQGITTIAVGQDGGSNFPVGDFLKRLDREPTALNVLTFVGHATVRAKVMGEDTGRTATESEINQMKSLVEQAMQDGAFGLSSGLEYEIGKPATTDEVISLAQVAGQYGGIYISHIRDEAECLAR